jgi:hypothetical protein
MYSRKHTQEQSKKLLSKSKSLDGFCPISPLIHIHLLVGWFRIAFWHFAPYWSWGTAPSPVFERWGNPLLETLVVDDVVIVAVVVFWPEAKHTRVQGSRNIRNYPLFLLCLILCAHRWNNTTVLNGEGGMQQFWGRYKEGEWERVERGREGERGRGRQ